MMVGLDLVNQKLVEDKYNCNFLKHFDEMTIFQLIKIKNLK